MLVASKVKMSGSEKKKKRKKAKRNTTNNIFFSTYNIFSINRVTRKFHVATTKAKNCRKQRAARAKFFFPN